MRGLRVLIIDDNADSAKSTGMLLSLEGCDVQLAYDGPEGIAAAGSFCPHAVLLDIGMPGMDGYEVARKLRADSTLTQTVLIAVSGYGQSEDQQRAVEAGFHHQLLKPVDFDELISVLGKIPLESISG